MSENYQVIVDIAQLLSPSLLGSGTMPERLAMLLTKKLAECDAHRQKLIEEVVFLNRKAEVLYILFDIYDDGPVNTEAINRVYQAETMDELKILESEFNV